MITAGVIVGIAQVASSGLFGVPTLYTTYERALQYIPNPRFTISYVLVEPKSAADVSNIKQQVQALGYLALTKDEFIDRISDFYKYQTGIGTNILIMTVMSFIVGLSISGQTFYTFVSGEPGEVRRPQSDGRKEPRIDPDDSVPGELHGAHGLRLGNRTVRAFDLAREAAGFRTMPP